MLDSVFEVFEHLEYLLYVLGAFCLLLAIIGGIRSPYLQINLGRAQQVFLFTLGGLALLLGALPHVREGRSVVPFSSGAVVAFDDNECPRGWREFTEGAGRVVVGVGSGKSLGQDLTTRHLGQIGGFEEVALTERQMPRHRHSNPTRGNGSADRVNSLQATGGGELDGKHQRPTGYSGEGEAHENMPPFIALLLCRKD